MTRKTIMDNIRRLAAFYCLPESFTDEKEIIRPDVDEVTLLFREYGRLLDINGAPRTGLSMIFVPESEYDEVLKWAKNAGKNIIYENDGRPIVVEGHEPIVTARAFGFIDNVGYMWDVKIKSA